MRNFSLSYPTEVPIGIESTCTLRWPAIMSPSWWSHWISMTSPTIMRWLLASIPLCESLFAQIGLSILGMGGRKIFKPMGNFEKLLLPKVPCPLQLDHASQDHFCSMFSLPEYHSGDQRTRDDRHGATAPWAWYGSRSLWPLLHYDRRLWPPGPSRWGWRMLSGFDALRGFYSSFCFFLFGFLKGWVFCRVEAENFQTYGKFSKTLITETSHPP